MRYRVLMATFLFLSAFPQAQAAPLYAFPIPTSPGCSPHYARYHHDYPANDILAKKGCKYVAVTSGTIDEIRKIDTYNYKKPTPLTKGGIYVSLIGDDGVRYYGSHLQKIAPGIEVGVHVEVGTLLGFVGDTGDARGTAPHVHFGISWPTTERDIYDRRILHQAILCQSWYGLRTGEVLSLEWRDIKFRQDDTAVVTLRPEITKTREGRLNINRADIFRRVLEFSKHTQPTDRVFASFSNDLNLVSESSYFYRRWVELKNEIRRRYPEFDMDTDPYCFRHFWITVRLLAGDSPYDIARLVGNSLRMIESHYDQVRNEQIAQKILSKKVKFNPDGTVTVEVVKKEK